MFASPTVKMSILLCSVISCLQSEHFHSLSKDPVISSLSAFEGIDNNGKRSVEVAIYCTICGVEKVCDQVSSAAKV